MICYVVIKIVINEIKIWLFSARDINNKSFTLYNFIIFLKCSWCFEADEKCSLSRNFDADSFWNCKSLYFHVFNYWYNWLKGWCINVMVTIIWHNLPSLPRAKWLLDTERDLLLVRFIFQQNCLWTRTWAPWVSSWAVSGSWFFSRVSETSCSSKLLVETLHFLELRTGSVRT